LLRSNDSPHPDFPEVLKVREKIQDFTSRVRNNEFLGVSGKPLVNTLCIGIGGSYLGPEFVAEALKTHPGCARAAGSRKLRFLANVDPVDFLRNTQDLDPSETLVVVISKTFTTAETMMNARRVKDWILSKLSDHPAADVVKKHIVAVSTNKVKVEEFGIDTQNMFGFWDWVGGRFSVTSAVGLLPLFLQYGENLNDFLKGANSVDEHFFNNCSLDKVSNNLPLMLGLIGWWNTEVMGFSARAILPYSQALVRFAAHIQQLDMESNGKQCTVQGERLESTGPLVFGEPGTNGQHSFYQLLHQGRTVPAEFIGFCKSHSLDVEAHNELMSNFFAQPDALALGKNDQQLLEEKCPEMLVPHKRFSGNRPSLSLLFEELSPYSCGQLLAIYEHRVAVEGFLWGINSFDQYGVELGKGLANQVKEVLRDGNFQGHPSEKLLEFYRRNRNN
jgi:glucose-6-phosphate isomerase